MGQVGSGLAEWFWLRGAHEVAVKVSAGAASSEASVGSGGAVPKKTHSRGWQLVLAGMSWFSST